jgi:hypothetical protein
MPYAYVQKSNTFQTPNQPVFEKLTTDSDCPRKTVVGKYSLFLRFERDSPIACERYWTHRPTMGYSPPEMGVAKLLAKTGPWKSDNGFRFPFKNCSWKVVLFSRDSSVKAAKSTDESTDESSLTNSL